MLVNRAIRAVVPLIQETMGEKVVEGGPRVIIGTVEGDRCDLGRDLVAPLLQGKGFDVEDLGTSVSLDEFIKAAGETPGTILVLYTRKLSSAVKMKALKSALAENASSAGARILLVGHHMSEEVRDNVGADDFCSEVLSTVAKVSELAGRA
jgi:methanogenic corrinoid protein MtbC1